MFCFDSFVRFQLEFINTFGLNFDEKQGGGKEKEQKRKKKTIKILGQTSFSLPFSLKSMSFVLFFYSVLTLIL